VWQKQKAVRRGEIKRLIINLPPRCLKSHCASVAFVAWMLGHEPSKHIICASYAQDLANEMAALTRTLMLSPLYRALFGSILSGRAVDDFGTIASGRRLATSVGGVLTGRGADMIIIDDLQKADDVWLPQIPSAWRERPNRAMNARCGTCSAFWRWKSSRRAGRPSVPPEIRRLIREMSLANPLWGAPRIHGELLKLGIDVGQTSVAKYMARRRRPPSQGWRTFLLNHADGIASIDLFVVPTISFKLLYGLLILRHDRRRIVWVGVTTSPTSEWIARQVREACGWEPVPDYLVRDRDRVYGQAFARRLRAMGIRDRPTAPRSPWQNGYAERLIGSIRRECLDHVIVVHVVNHIRT
jgi:transposase InsO family protein